MRILLCWGYHRRGWVAPYERLLDDFDFHYLFHQSEEEEEGVFTNQPRHYWNEFRTAQEALDEIRPDKLVFMSLFGLRPIALNMVARRRGIRTFIFQHGYFRSLENYMSHEPGPPKRPEEPRHGARANSAWRAIRFMLRSNLREEPLDCSRAVVMLLESRRTDQYRSQLRFRFRGRMPDRYITYSEETSEFHRQLDGAPSSSITPIGIPEFDPIFQHLADATQSRGNDVLLIDSPNADNRYGIIATTIQEKVRFLVDLAERLEDRGRSLVVKLHPETYDATWLPSHPNLRYVRDAEMGQLIHDAQACIGFDSTLVIPAIIARPTLLFELRESSLLTGARELGVATVVRGLRCSREQLDGLLAATPRAGDQIERFIQSFAHSADGHATQRLATVLSESGA